MKNRLLFQRFELIGFLQISIALDATYKIECFVLHQAKGFGCISQVPLVKMRMRYEEHNN